MLDAISGEGSDMGDSRLCRSLEKEMFEKTPIKECLKKLAKHVTAPNSKWHMEFRGNNSQRNTVDLYCKGLVLRLHFQKQTGRFTARMNEKLAEKLIQQNIAVEEYINGRPLEDFDKFIALLPRIEKEYWEYKFNQHERENECDLAKGMNSAKTAFIADIEVTLSKTADYVQAVQASKSNPEGDLLVMVREGSQYFLLPVEMKMVDAKKTVLDEAEKEIRTFLNVIYGIDEKKPGFFRDFKRNYQFVCNQKREIGLLKDADMEIGILNEKPEIPIGLILILNGQGKNQTNHRLTRIPDNKLQLISEAQDQYSIYALKCDIGYFQSCEWVKQLK